MFSSLPQPILWVLDVFQQNDKEIFLVGGCVRDELLKRPIHDYDMTTNATPQEMIAMFETLPCKIIPTGIQHGTITILYNDMSMEITTYRHDGIYEDHRKPKSVSFTENLKEDLARRDFTINAMAYHPNVGLVDPMHGQADCEQGLIRCVGTARTRFEEDALRILRALRFSFQLHFEITTECDEAIQSQASSLQHISQERIREEFNKMLMSHHPALLQTLKQSGTLTYILPEITMIYDISQESKWHIYDVFTHTDVALDHTTGYTLEEKLAIVFHDLGKAKTKSFDDQGHAHFYGHPAISASIAQTIMKRLAYSKKQITTVQTFITYHDYYVTPNTRILRRFLSHVQMDYPLAYSILRVQYADDMAKNPTVAQAKITNLQDCVAVLQRMEKEHTPVLISTMAVNGTDMIQLGFQKQSIGNVLQYLYNQVLDEPTKNTKENLLQLAKEYKKTHVS